MTRVKICGIRRLDDALAAVEAGADYLGFVFAPSRRHVAPHLARQIISESKTQGNIQAVGVFVNENADDMNRVARSCGLDYVQLSGEEPDDMVGQLEVPAIQVLHVGEEDTSERLLERASRSAAKLLLLDTGKPGMYGGTGTPFTWEIGQELCRQRDVLLAGGLTPTNVGDAIRTVRPWGVDVSGGVERHGHKHEGDIRAFVSAVRETDRAL